MDCLSIYLSMHLVLYLTMCLSDYLALYLFVYPPIYLSIRLSIDLSIYLSTVFFSFLSFYLKGSNSARLPTSEPQNKEVSETSSLFELGNIKNEAIPRDVLQKWKVECRADGLVPTRFAFFPPYLSKVLRPRHKK